MFAQTDELKLSLDESAHRMSDAFPRPEDWDAWVVYLLEELELLAASLDPQHPAEYRAFLESLRDEIHTKLKRGAWKKRLELTSPIIRGQN